MSGATAKRGEHTRKWLVVLDNTPECIKAVSFAAHRVRNTGGAIVLLVVNEPEEFQHWVGVEDVLRAEKLQAAETLFEQYESKVRALGDIKVERVVREGRRASEVEGLIKEDTDIVILVLAAGASAEGPGPLVSLFTSRGANGFPIPVAIVPGTLSEAEIEALS
jgi:nucleotide-binding universal stress UspA family protein